MIAVAVAGGVFVLFGGVMLSMVTTATRGGPTVAFDARGHEVLIGLRCTNRLAKPSTKLN